MPDPGSHRYDIQPPTRLRDRYDDEGQPDQHADEAANAELQQRHPPRPAGDPDRAAGPLGDRGTNRGTPGIDEPPRPLAGGLELRSTAFTDSTMIPERHARDAGNVSPELEWRAIPDGTAELVLLCEDPDAPDGPFVHWLVTGINPEVTGVAEGTPVPGATELHNSYGEPGWGGPHPPVGDEPRRYFFRLYALDTHLGLDTTAGVDEVRAALDGHVLSTGTLVGLFAR
jgi:Raf kinase inhibitor-like YbhB/YbcL family protein